MFIVYIKLNYFFTKSKDVSSTIFGIESELNALKGELQKLNGRAKNPHSNYLKTYIVKVESSRKTPYIINSLENIPV